MSDQRSCPQWALAAKLVPTLAIKLSPSMSRRTVRSSFKYLKFFVYELADRLEQMHTLTVHVDTVFDTINLEEVCNRT